MLTGNLPRVTIFKNSLHEFFTIHALARVLLMGTYAWAVNLSLSKKLIQTSIRSIV